MSEPMLVTYPIENVYPSPFQKRKPAFIGPEWEAFCDDIRVNGVKYPPTARPHPTKPDAVQLQDGERRYTAWTLTHPGEPFTVLVSPISDREMFEFGVRLNVQRRAFNDIELADIAADYIEKFGATQSETARLIGYKTGAGVSNLVKLRKLPPEIQQHVVGGNLPDALARQLVSIAGANKKAALQIASDVAAAPKSEKVDVFHNALQKGFMHNTENLDRLWPMDWLADEPKEVERDLGDGDHFIGACAGCPFRLDTRCARKACFEEKLNIWTLAEIERVGKGLQLTGALEGEKVDTLFDNHYGDADGAQLLLKSKKEIRSTLRLVRVAELRYFNNVERVLGSRVLTLGSTDKAACAAYLAPKPSVKAARVEKSPNETDAQRAKRVAAEKKEQEENRAARSAMWKAYHDGLWLLEHAAREIGEQLMTTIVNPKFVEAIEEEFCSHNHSRLGADEIERRIKKEIKDESVKTVIDALRLSRVALNVMAESAVKQYFKASENERELDYEGVHDDALDTAEKFGVALPDGWDVPPVHKTEFNCWLCGTFAGNTSEKLTQRDIKEDGWVDDGKNGVFCSQAHKEEYNALAISETAGPKAKDGKRASAGKAKAKRK